MPCTRYTTPLKFASSRFQALCSASAGSRADLPLCCPRPADKLWNMHPRVYLPIENSPDGTAVCPYCGAHYRLID